MSAAAEEARPAVLPPEWERLEEAARGAASSLALWRRRALEAEEEVRRLRAALEGVSREAASAPEGEEELRRLRAENALLLSRTAEARKRVSGLLSRLSVLESRR